MALFGPLADLAAEGLDVLAVLGRLHLLNVLHCGDVLKVVLEVFPTNTANPAQLGGLGHIDLLLFGGDFFESGLVHPLKRIPSLLILDLG